jgi:hyperosmotically inducible periplasmic protein
MKSILLLAALILSSMVACNTDPIHDDTKDNTNLIDRDNDAPLAPFGELETSSDRALTENILKTEGLSVHAKNIKIVTRGGVVTLHGPVNSGAEKAAIEDLAESTSGVKRVDNELEIAD